MKSACLNHVDFLEHRCSAGRMQGLVIFLSVHLGLTRCVNTAAYSRESCCNHIILLLLKRLWVKYTSSDFLFSRSVLLSGSSETSFHVK